MEAGTHVFCYFKALRSADMDRGVVAVEWCTRCQSGTRPDLHCACARPHVTSDRGCPFPFSHPATHSATTHPRCPLLPYKWPRQAMYSHSSLLEVFQASRFRCHEPKLRTEVMMFQYGILSVDSIVNRWDERMEFF